MILGTFFEPYFLNAFKKFFLEFVPFLTGSAESAGFDALELAVLLLFAGPKG